MTTDMFKVLFDGEIMTTQRIPERALYKVNGVDETPTKLKEPLLEKALNEAGLYIQALGDVRRKGEITVLGYGIGTGRYTYGKE